MQAFTPEQAARHGMGLALAAREHPERLAIVSRYRDRTFGELNARANQLARALRRRGLGAGDSVALICANRPEFAVAAYAALRTGMRLTPISCHLTPEETAYIVEHCDARALLVDARYAAAGVSAARSVTQPPGAPLLAKLAIGEPIPGFEDYYEALEAEANDDISDPELGSHLIYTSGTTGRPKGVHHATRVLQQRPGFAEVAAHAGYRPGRDLHLCTGPLYQQSHLLMSLMMPLSFGCGVLMMYRWSAQRALELIDGYGVTHTHMVPSMLRHLLALPDDLRSQHSLRSLRMLLHGAAPCPPVAKQALLEWFGPVLYEYYAATEGWGCISTPAEWRERPGTVGRPAAGTVEIRGEDGAPRPSDEAGTIHLRIAREADFSYHKDPELTDATFAGDFLTLGDIGSLDAGGYLYVRDRDADTITREGVPIYPAEVDAVLVTHPAVADAGTIGLPHPELGEQVVSVVVLRDGQIPGPDLAEQLVQFCRERMADEKCPGRVDFADRLPRRETGKMLRRVLRDGYKERAVSLPISSD
jgi:long-chain acyl-CoA synthetase